MKCWSAKNILAFCKKMIRVRKNDHTGGVRDKNVARFICFCFELTPELKKIGGSYYKQQAACEGRRVNDALYVFW